MTERLSDILTIRSDFNLFKSITNLEPFELQNLMIVVDDLITYTLQTEQILQTIEHEFMEKMENDYDWVNEGYEKFYDLFRNIDSIDSVVLQALNLLENNIDKDAAIADTDIFDKLDDLNEKSLRIKRHYLVPLKIKVDLTIEYNEIYNLTMNSINMELESCLKKCFKIHEKRFSSPVRHAPSFSLDMLTKKLLQQRDHLKLPLLNKIDTELYEEYLDLKSAIDPIEASLKYIPSRVETFEKQYCDLLTASNLDRIIEKYEDLVKEFNYLNNEVKELKYDLIDSRWNEIFSYLNTEMSFLINSVEKELSKISKFTTENDKENSFKTQILKRLRYITNIVENTFILINQAINEDLISFAVVEKSNELAKDWLNVKALIPEEVMSKIEDETINNTNDNEDKDHDDIVHNMKKLSLELKPEVNRESRKEQKATPLKDKRRSKAGELLMGRMNLVPVLIEKNPTSVRKPDENKVLSNSHKVNQLDFSHKKLTNALRNIPNLQKSKGSLSSSTEDSESNSDRESPQVHAETLAQLLGDSSPLKDDTVFETPVPRSKRYVSNGSVIAHETIKFGTQIEEPAPVADPDFEQEEFKQEIISKPQIEAKPSKLRLPKEVDFKSKIPRPVSRLGAVSDRSLSSYGLNGRATSSLGVRSEKRPATSLAVSRPATIEESPDQKSFRHSIQSTSPSVFQETPVRSSRRSLLPQPTPVREIIGKSSSRLSHSRHSDRYEPFCSTISTSASRSNSRVGSRSEPRRISRPGSSLGKPPPRPTWH